MIPLADSISPEFRRHVENIYTLVPKDDGERIADNLIDIMAAGSDRKQPLKSVLEQVARFVFRQFGFSEVAIGLKDRREPVWRYEVALGFTKEIEARIFRTRYDHEDMYSQERFPNIKIGKLSEFNIAEGRPVNETDKYDRPYRWTAKRTELTEFLPGDFIDVWMVDEKKEFIGWIEVSGPKDKKQPPRSTVRWLELLASICSEIVRTRWAEEGAVAAPRAPTPVPPPKD